MDRISNFLRSKPGTMILFVLAVLALFAMQPPYPTKAQVFDPGIGRRVPVAGAIAADDTDIVMKIRYIGSGSTPDTNNSGVVAVAANGSLTFTQGVQGSETATTEFECPVSGALGGIIDVTNAACNTVGEVLNVINASTSWRAVPIDALLGDDMNTRVLTQAATRATTADGLSILWDTSTAFDMTVLMNEPSYRTIRPYLNGRNLNLRPFENQTTSVHIANATSTYGSGTSNIRFYSTNLRFSSNTARAASETATLLYSEAGGATTVNKIFSSMSTVGIYSQPGERLLARLDNSAAGASEVLYAYGFKYRIPTPN